MIRCARTTALAAAAALLAIAQPAPAAAQAGLPTYCGGALVTNAMHANVRSNGRTAELDYFAQFQARDRGLTVSVARFTTISINGRVWPVIRHMGNVTFNPRQQQQVQLLTLHVNNPSGLGAPSALDAGRAVILTCSFG